MPSHESSGHHPNEAKFFAGTSVDQLASSFLKASGLHGSNDSFSKGANTCAPFATGLDDCAREFDGGTCGYQFADMHPMSIGCVCANGGCNDCV